MRIDHLGFEYKVYTSAAELSPGDRKLWELAIRAQQSAHAPYSDFKVGAAVLLDNQEIILGSNQENAAFPSGLCAERVALFYAHSQFPENQIMAIAVTADSEVFNTSDIISPCGSCRQVMAEIRTHQESPIKILFPGSGQEIIEMNDISGLIPFMFRLKK